MQEEEGVSVQETESPSVTAEKRLPYGIQKYKHIITLLICVTLSLIFMKTGFLSLIYLVPLGYAIIVSGNLLPVFITAAAANFVIIVIRALSNNDGLNNILLEALYSITVLFGFSWIIGGKFMRTVYRFVIASAVCTVMFLIFINTSSSNTFKILNETAKEIFNNYNLKPEGTAVDSFFTLAFAPQEIVELAKIFLLRGGALISMFFIFFINRQIAVIAVSLIKKQKFERGLTAFYAPVNTIWVLSGSLASIALSGIFKIEVLITLSWNVFTVCAIIFLAQGVGVLTYWLSLRSTAFRLLINIMIVVLLFSPLSIFAIMALFLLGIIDNWRPFRVLKSAQ
jgi:hypothetical protein